MLSCAFRNVLKRDQVQHDLREVEGAAEDADFDAEDARH